MNKYQKFVLDRTRCAISEAKEFAKETEARFASAFVLDNDAFEIPQGENYNIKKYFLLLDGSLVEKVELDGVPYEPFDSGIARYVPEKTLAVPVDFDHPANQLTLFFVDNVVDPLVLKLSFKEVDHAIYDGKIQEELNKQICPEHKTGNDLVNIYWNLVSNEVVTTQVVLYVVSDSVRMIGRYKESESTFKSITGLAYGKYLYEIIEFDKDGKEVARTPKIGFTLSGPARFLGKGYVCG